MSRPQTLPDLEDLAAYIDGRLDDARRVEVEARLADDEDYYELFLETVRLQRELAEEEPSVLADGPGKVVPIRRRRGFFAGLAVAAGLALAVGWSQWERDPLAGLDSSSILEDSRLGERNLKAWRGEVVRRGSKAYTLGVWTVNLEIASLSDTDRAIRLLVEASSQLHDETHALALSRAQNDFGELKDDLDAGRVDAARLRAEDSVRRLEKDLQRRNLEGDYNLGQWVEAGRLAVLAGDRNRVARALRGVGKRIDPEDWPQDAESFEELSKLLEGAGESEDLELDPETSSRLLDAFRKIHYKFSD